jgi:hypothetical protein
MVWQPVATLAFLLLARTGSETATFHGSDASTGRRRDRRMSFGRAACRPCPRNGPDKDGLDYQTRGHSAPCNRRT